MAIILGILIGLVAVATVLIVVAMRWLQALLDAWRRIAIHQCGSVLSIVPNKHFQSAPPLPPKATPGQVTDSKPHL